VPALLGAVESNGVHLEGREKNALKKRNKLRSIKKNAKDDGSLGIQYYGEAYK